MTILIIKKLPNSSLKFYPEASKQWVNMAKGNLKAKEQRGFSAFIVQASQRYKKKNPGIPSALQLLFCFCSV